MTNGPTMRERLLDDARRFSAETGVPLTSLGYKVAGNSHLFERVAAGGDVTTGTYEKFRAYFEAERRCSAARGIENTPPDDAAATADRGVFFAFIKSCAGFFRKRQVS